MKKLTTIYLQLLNEGTLVYRSVMAEEIGDQLFQIKSNNSDQEDEEWQFKTGDVVKCELRSLVDHSPEECLVATEKVRL